jgi:hypothetical protein
MSVDQQWMIVKEIGKWYLTVIGNTYKADYSTLQALFSSI